jgi:hypothetical protein
MGIRRHCARPDTVIRDSAGRDSFTRRSSDRYTARRPFVLAIDGSDASGKTTTATKVAALLRHRGLRVCLLGGLSAADGVFPDLPPTELSEWWFETASASTVVDCIIRAAVYRDSQPTGSSQFAIIDRGGLTVLSSCAALLLLRDETTIGTSISLARKHAELLGHNPPEHATLMLEFPCWRVAWRSFFERGQRPMHRSYERYEHALFDVIRRLARTWPATVRVPASQAADEVATRIANFAMAKARLSEAIK